MINEAFEKLKESIYLTSERLEVEVYVTPEPVSFENRYTGSHLVLEKGDKWGELFDCGWFHFTGTVPRYSGGVSPVLLIDVNGELLLYDSKGNPLRGLTSGSSVFDRSLGSPGKRVFYLPPSLKPGDAVDYWADGGCNDLFGELQGNGTVSEAAVALCNKDVRELYYDFEFFLDILKNVSPGSDLYKRACRLVHEGSSLLKDLSPESLESARKLFSGFFRGRKHGDSLTISAVGHSHLDLAWLWPVRETRRKIGRTLATAFDLMERYSGYIYGQSQPQLLDWVKEDYPSLFEKFNNMISSGRVEPLGAGWVEFDTNLPSGESLVRQILYGKLFWKEKYGIDMDFLWLPDSFGFTGALPQIMKKSGVRFLVTMKLAWNSVNKFPYHSFFWRGIDGSEVITHILPEGNYNSPAGPGSALRIRDDYNEKEISSHALMVYGIGDGGGGPGAEHLERLERINRVDNLPEVKKERVRLFLGNLEKKSDRFHFWEGDLYLEKHQGTFTTEALSKYYNRTIEKILFRYELLSVLAFINGKVRRTEKMEEIWKEVLLYQFHDILPGTSIKRVYEESWSRYRSMIAFVNEQIDILVKDFIASAAVPEGASSDNKHLFLFNFLSHEVRSWYFMDDGWHRITVPGIGYRVVELTGGINDFPGLAVGDGSIENEFLYVSFNSDGSIDSVFDKEEGREYIKEGGLGNRFSVFTDSGDAWDFSEDYRSSCEKMVFTGSRIERDGPRLINIQTYVYGNSRMEQKIIVTAGVKRIDFETEVTWKDPEKVLRTSFDVSFPEGKAFCGNAFGAIERPVENVTSWDRAKDEVPCHGWVDISDGEYGAAVISGTKYGYSVKKRIIDLCLIRCVKYPGSELLGQGYTDMGRHSFTYSFYPHRGNYSDGNVVSTAEELGHPVKAVFTKMVYNKLPVSNTLFGAEDASVIISAVKIPERGEGIIIRCYESSGESVNTFIYAAPSIIKRYKRVYRVNLVEDYEEELHYGENGIPVSFKPYEIISFRLTS